MTRQEIAQALRCTSTPGGQTGDCEKCPYWKTEQLTAEQKEKLGVDTWTSCDIDKVGTDAAELIERLTAENADLGKEIEWKDMVIALAQREQAKAEAERNALIEQIKERLDCRDCKHNDFCDFDSYTVLDCMNCVPEVCPCAGCFDSSRWEWRGLPEAPDIRTVCTDEDNLCMSTCNRKPDGYCAYRLRNDGTSIGKNVFLTREEAEKALQEMEGKEEGRDK